MLRSESRSTKSAPTRIGTSSHFIAGWDAPAETERERNYERAAATVATARQREVGGVPDHRASRAIPSDEPRDGRRR